MKANHPKRRDKLYESLKSRFTEKNLSLISIKIIESYRRNNFTFLNQLQEHLRPFFQIHKKEANKLFSALIKIYHPDRLSHYLNEIESGYRENNLAKLEQYNCLIDACDEKFIKPGDQHIDPEIWSAMDVEFWYEDSDFDRVVDLEEESFTSDYQQSDAFNIRDIISVIRERENLSEASPESLEFIQPEGELDLSGTGLNDLNGIEYCTNLHRLDLSNNDLMEIAPLGYLYNLEELFLSANKIDSVAGLNKLIGLKILDLSNNHLTDISSLLKLPRLEFLNLMGNRVIEEQVRELRKKQIVVVT